MGETSMEVYNSIHRGHQIEKSCINRFKTVYIFKENIVNYLSMFLKFVSNLYYKFLEKKIAEKLVQLH